MPKRGCKVATCEIFRFYKLYATKPVCEPVSMIVPRKVSLPIKFFPNSIIIYLEFLMFS